MVSPPPFSTWRQHCSPNHLPPLSTSIPHYYPELISREKVFWGGKATSSDYNFRLSTVVLGFSEEPRLDAESRVNNQIRGGGGGANG